MAALRTALDGPEELRRRRLGALLRLVHDSGSVSRAGLAAATGLGRSSVKAIVEELAAEGLVREGMPSAPRSAGRPSFVVQPRSESVYVLALDVGVQHLSAVRVGLGGVVLDRRRLPQTPADFDVERTLRRLVGLTAELAAATPVGAVCTGIGVGVCGVVSPDDGLVRFAPNLGWVDVPLRGLIEAALGTDLPVVLGNDGDVGVVAEHLRGAAAGCADVVFVTGEVGIGGGVILDGRQVRGTGGYAGEIGHMSVDPQGRDCRCGRRGCWETEIGDAAVLESVGAPAGMTLTQVLAAYTAGEEWVRPGLLRVAEALGRGTADLVNIFNPQLVVFGGAVGQVFTAVEPLVHEAAASALVAARQGARLVVAQLGDDATVVGAAELAFAPLLEDPLGTLARTRRAGPVPA